MRRAYDERQPDENSQSEACDTCGVIDDDSQYPNGHAVGCPESLALNPVFSQTLKQLFRERKFVTRNEIIEYCYQNIDASYDACERFVERAIERGVIIENDDNLCFKA